MSVKLLYLGDKTAFDYGHSPRVRVRERSGLVMADNAYWVMLDKENTTSRLRAAKPCQAVSDYALFQPGSIDQAFGARRWIRTGYLTIEKNRP